MSRFNFFFLVKNADSVTPNCQFISFSVVELQGKNKQTLKKETQFFLVFSKLHAWIFPCEETFCVTDLFFLFV